MARHVVFDSRSRQGTLTSPDGTVPQNASLVRVWGDVDDLTLTREFRVEFQASADDGQTWQTWYAFGYVGPMIEQPYMEFDLTRFRGQRVRVRLTIPVALVLGATLEVT